MFDQAKELRQLVLRAAGARRSAAHPAPKLVVLLGGKGGVGTTTLAINLAIALSQAGRRSVLVDADLAGPDIAALCRLDERYDIADVLTGSRCVHEVLQPGAAGIQVLPGAWGRAPATASPLSTTRLIDQLRALGAHAEWIVVDAGSGGSALTEPFWQAADYVLPVATPDVAAIMGTYALLKMHWQNVPQPAVSLVVNQAADGTEAADVHHRLSTACRRFLGVTLTSAGWISEGPEVVSAGSRRMPLLLEHAECGAARGVAQLAEWLTSEAGRPAAAQNSEESLNYQAAL